MLKEPKYKNKENLMYCFSAFPCFTGDKLPNFTKKEVLDLIIDVDKFYAYVLKVIKKEPFGIAEFVNAGRMKEFIKDKEQQRVELLTLTSDVWGGIWHWHEAIIPAKYKEDLEITVI